MKLFFYALLCTSLFCLASCGDSKKPSAEINLTNVKEVARLTGDPLEGETIPSPNNTAKDYDVYATDLGIMWHMDGNNIGLFFGDTNGEGFVAGKGGGNGANWRSNFVAFSDDTNMEDGLTINSMAVDEEGKAREICAGAKWGRENNSEKYETSIPTGAIRAGNLDCVHYMNIYDWAGPKGRWLTNFSSMYTSADNGKTWERQASVQFASDSYFSQVAYAKKDGYVYMAGTLSGRASAVYLGRFKENDILDMQQYEYWNGDEKKWEKGNESAATAIIPGPVGEASLLYHEKYNRWIFTYNYDYAYDDNSEKRRGHAIMYRDAEDLTGEWSEMKVLLSDKEYKGLYCAYMHPLKNNEDKIYFLMSLWNPYNVFLMSADIEVKK